MGNYLVLLLGIILCFLESPIIWCQQGSRGMYFEKKEYDGKDLPLFSESRDQLPEPILDDHQEWIDMYWKCWEMAFKHFKKPLVNSPFVSNILDEAFNANIFQWDMIFMIMFARYSHHVFPAINSLDNFYCNQHTSGYICRELSGEDGSDFVYEGRKNTINPPLFSWAEIESFRNTGDISRFELVLPVLEKYAQWLSQEGDMITANHETDWYKYGRRAAHSEHGLFWNTGLGSGMDNTPRGGDGWVDMSCQMVIQYNNLAFMSNIIGLKEKEQEFQNAANAVGNRINKYCWNEEDGLYYDVDHTGNQVKFKTSGCFWPMLAGIASREQAMRLVENLEDSVSFWRKIVFPTLAADEPEYNPLGGYWRGAVWAPTNYMIIKGLEKYGYEELAARASLNYIEAIYRVYESSGTFWENYMPDYYAPGQPSKPDFVGWTGIGPIALLIENILGFRVNAADQSLIWHVTRNDRHGIKNLRVGTTVVSAVCHRRERENDPPELFVEVSKKLKLSVIYLGKEHVYELEPGEYNITID